MASMRPDTQRLCNADHRTAEEWLGNALEKNRSAKRRICVDKQRNETLWNSIDGDAEEKLRME